MTKRVQISKQCVPMCARNPIVSVAGCLQSTLTQDPCCFMFKGLHYGQPLRANTPNQK